MTLEEAIKIVEQHTNWYDPKKTVEEITALRLGIEALKYIKEWRLPPHGGATILLPGETEK